LQVALYYLFVVRPYVPTDESAVLASDKFYDARALQCGRRMFLAALILASKYLQDKNFSARAWSKISGLNITEINANELAFLAAVNWRLHISDCIFDKWTKIVLKCTPTTSILPGQASAVECRYPENKWVHILSNLDMSLDASALDEILNEGANSSASCSIAKLNSSAGFANASIYAETDYCMSSAASRNCADINVKMTSMAFALASPCTGRTICNESMPPRSISACEERNTIRGIRKSSLSMCETIEPSEMVTCTADSPASICTPRTACSTSLQTPVYKRSSFTKVSDKSSILTDSRQRTNNSNAYAPSKAPVREEILGKSIRPESRRFTSAPSALYSQENPGKTRKRGNETPVAARHQKKQKDKVSEFASQKPSEIAPSGLTPQMRQMSTSFSVTGKKGNGLRMSINPSFALPGNHGQGMRPSTGQRSMSHVVYG